MNYSNNPGLCRVDFFKPSGKWYATESINFTGHYNHEDGPVGALRAALAVDLRKEDGSLRYEGMWAVCSDPYHVNAYPVMVVVGS